MLKVQWSTVELVSLEEAREARDNIISLNANTVRERRCFCDQASKNKRALCWVSDWACWCRKYCAHWCPRASISWSGDPETSFSFPLMSGLSAFIKPEISGLKVQKATRGEIIPLLPRFLVPSKNNPTIFLFFPFDWNHLGVNYLSAMETICHFMFLHKVRLHMMKPIN